MDRPFIFRVLLTSIFIVVLPAFVWPSVSLTTVRRSSKNDIPADIFRQQQDEKKDENKEKQDPKQQPDKPDIREVPKARNQSRPPVVAKPNIKAKPVKVIRPKIKRP